MLGGKIWSRPKGSNKSRVLARMKMFRQTLSNVCKCAKWGLILKRKKVKTPLKSIWLLPSITPSGKGLDVWKMIGGQKREAQVDIKMSVPYQAHMGQSLDWPDTGEKCSLDWLQQFGRPSLDAISFSWSNLPSCTAPCLARTLTLRLRPAGADRSKKVRPKGAFSGQAS